MMANRTKHGVGPIWDNDKKNLQRQVHGMHRTQREPRGETYGFFWFGRSKQGQGNENQKKSLLSCKNGRMKVQVKSGDEFFFGGIIRAGGKASFFRMMGCTFGMVTSKT